MPSLNNLAPTCHSSWAKRVKTRAYVRQKISENFVAANSNKWINNCKANNNFKSVRMDWWFAPRNSWYVVVICCLCFSSSSSIFCFKFQTSRICFAVYKIHLLLGPPIFCLPQSVLCFPLRQFPSIPAADSFNKRKHVISIKHKNTEKILKFCSFIHKDVLISFIVIRRIETFTKLLTCQTTKLQNELQNLITLWFSKLWHL